MQVYNQSAQGQASQQRREDKLAAGRAANKAAREAIAAAIAAEQKAAQTAREAAATAFALPTPRSSPPPKAVPWDTKPTSGVVGLTVLQPKFLEQFPNARFHFKSGRIDQQGTFKGVWLNAERTEWALEKEQQWRYAHRRQPSTPLNKSEGAAFRMFHDGCGFLPNKGVGNSGDRRGQLREVQEFVDLESGKVRVGLWPGEWLPLICK